MGLRLHFHKTFSEKFEVKEGVLFLQVGKEKKRMVVGESVTVPAGTAHRFYNETDDDGKISYHFGARTYRYGEFHQDILWTCR